MSVLYQFPETNQKTNQSNQKTNEDKLKLRFRVHENPK